MSDRKKVHQGRNIRRFREMLNLKQEALAWEMGEEWSQKRVSQIEQKEFVNDDILERLAAIMKIPVEAFRNFDEELAISLISNTATFDNCQQPAFYNQQPTFNPLDKLIETFDEVKRLSTEIVRVKDEQITLYERMLREKEEFIARLDQLLTGSKKV